MNRGVNGVSEKISALTAFNRKQSGVDRVELEK